MKSIFLSAGHSDKDPGAVALAVKDAQGRIIRPERREADIGVEFRNIVSFYLQRDRVTHQLDGIGTENLPLSIAAARARSHPLSFEFHCNAVENPKATGIETLSSPGNVFLASRICEALAQTLKLRNRGAKPENSGQHKRLAFVQAGGIIVELFFISNPDDLAAYDARKWLAGRAVAAVLTEAARSS